MFQSLSLASTCMRAELTNKSVYAYATNTHNADNRESKAVSLMRKDLSL